MKKYFILTYLILSSCAFRIEDEETLRKEAANQLLETLVKNSSVQRVSSNQIEAFLTDEEDFNSFKFSASWPKRAYRAEIKIDGITEESSESFYLKRNIEGRAKPLQVLITLFNELGGIIGQEERELKFPQDLSISKSAIYEGELHANRLLITTGGQIITNGNDLTIRAKKIIVEDAYNPGSAFRAEDAHILTVLPGTKSPTTEGKPSHAVIKIEADEGIGDLRVAMIGYEGNNGITPHINHPPGPPGPNGDSGVSQDVGRYCVDERGRPCRAEVICKVPPKAAGNGEPGVEGIQGASGQDGGDSGDLIINIKNSSYFFAKVIARPGLGGSKGERGKGGPGGPPGKTPPPAKGCNAPPLANKGENGPDGPEGNDGMPGKIGFIDGKKTILHIAK